MGEKEKKFSWIFICYFFLHDFNNSNFFCYGSYRRISGEAFPRYTHPKSVG